MKRIRPLLLTTTLLFSTLASATNIPVDLLNWNSGHSGSSYDSATGKYYYSDTYTSNSITEYENKTDFEARTNGRTFTLQDGTKGTYFEVRNGVVHSRTDSGTNLTSTWDLFGTKLSTVSNAGYFGSNGYSTFNWGGYSGMNFMQDNDNLYLFGIDNRSTGLLSRVSEDGSNSVLEQWNVSSTNSHFGAAFIINDYLFYTDSYNNSTLNYKMDLATGIIQTGLNLNLVTPSSDYLTNFNYVADSDTLYGHNVYGGSSFKLENASLTLGAPLQNAPIPEPSILALMGLGLLGLAGINRRKQTKGMTNTQ